MSLTELEIVYEKLVNIREYLVKIGPIRRQNSQTAQNKFKEAQIVYSRLEPISSEIKIKIENSELIGETVQVINKYIENIHSIYRFILSLVFTVEKNKTLDDSQNGADSLKMADNFDIKTAIALLPVMTGQEQITSQLIDSIQLYSSMIDENAHKQLIEFVLKTRLSASAKLRLKSKYATVESLINDMRTHLIQKKSAVAIQSQLHEIKQGRRSIEKFGADLEQLFVNLTIAQADGDDKKYDILRQLNEKIAIKRFADGLSNQRLSTIIAARTFDSLLEAIRTAIDENSLSPTDEQPVMKIRQNFNRGYAHNRGRSRVYFSSNRYSNTGRDNKPQYHNNNGSSYGQNHGRGKPTRGTTRGRYRGSTPRYMQNSANVMQAQRTSTDTPERTQVAPNSEFFRAFNE
ncbi:hypothetical protein JYU34_018539 [Plutella xylostella]|uniref:Uncharacterized protein n=1 Tax=Plutella xylostella TaxID=51655 RepID=A0ABQ7PXX8_PLUXY|nr:hypothetical protein JYU34_018539 [Plutella xylostella]